jgi:hypothetical protein
MDAYGWPIGLFTTNRWVTNQTWYSAADTIRMLDRFLIDHAYPSWPVNRWISAMFRLFRPQIVELLERRDQSHHGSGWTRIRTGTCSRIANWKSPAQIRIDGGSGDRGAEESRGRMTEKTEKTPLIT